MKSKNASVSTSLAVSALLIIGAGCGKVTKSSAGSVTIDGRQITYSIDGPASVAGTDPLMIEFGSHKLQRQGGNFLLDGRNVGGVGGANSIELIVSNSTRTRSSGNSKVMVPFTR